MSDGAWWTARVTRLAEPSKNALFWPTNLGSTLAEALVDRPVRCCLVAGRFVHPEPFADVDPANVAFLIGLVERAWVNRDSVFAVFHLAVDGRGAVARRGMLAMERDGVLSRGIGVSIVGVLDTVPRDIMGRQVRVVTRIHGILGVDLVSAPAGSGARVLRSTIPTPERSLTL